MIEVTVKKGHYGYAERFYIRSNGALIDLSSYAVTWKIWEVGATSVKWELTGTVIETGVVDFDVEADDFTIVGSFEAEIEWTKTGAKDGTKTFHVKVEASN